MMRHAHRKKKNSYKEAKVKKDALSFMREADKQNTGKVSRREFYEFYKEH